MLFFKRVWFWQKKINCSSSGKKKSTVHRLTIMAYGYGLKYGWVLHRLLPPFLTVIVILLLCYIVLLLLLYSVIYCYCYSDITFRCVFEILVHRCHC